MTDKMTIKFLKDFNTIVMKNEGRGLFITTSNSLIISITNLAYLLKILIDNNFLSIKVLEGIVEEYNSFSGKYENN